MSDRLFPTPGPSSDVAGTSGQLPSVLWAPAKLTLSLRVTGLRPDGYHLLDAQMVSIDLADRLELDVGKGVTFVDEVVGGFGLGALATAGTDLVGRALELVGRHAAVRVHKRIPVGAGLGGGSADAAAVVRWAGPFAPEVASRLGADVPFCVQGGRGRVTGIGERIESLRYERRHFVLVLPPFGVDTGAVYRAYDVGVKSSAPPLARDGDGNDLERAALTVAPDLARWRDALGDVSGRRPRLAGSGSTWFVEGELEELGMADRPYLEIGGLQAPVVAVQTVPERWQGPARNGP
jgi:4-diphosphocytidyl-2-C-methyl-D-erythritol kinase